MKKNILISILLLLCSILKAQFLLDTVRVQQQDSTQSLSAIAAMSTSIDYEPGMPEMLLPSPESQVFQRFKGFEPNYGTGAVNVTIPLHTVSCGNFTMPLTLAYQNNGIKVDDPCYPLGYGWALHPGLRITRTIRGRPDEYYSNKSILENIESDSGKNLRDLYYGVRNSDTQHDFFTLVLPEGNCSFLIQPLTTAYDSPWEAIVVDGPYKIEILKHNLANIRIYGFIVKDDKGLIYYFGNEHNEGWEYLEYTPNEDGLPRTTTFFLRKVVLPSSEEIVFKWHQGIPSSHIGAFEYRAYYIDYPNAVTYNPYLPPISGPDTGNFEDNYYSHSARSSEQTALLSEVVAPNFRIFYYYTSISGYGNFLRLINIYTKDGNQLVKSIKFDISDKLLNSITINEVEKYNFEYNSQRIEKAKGKDFWGYYNGANNNCLYPTVSFMTYSQYGIPMNSPYTFKGADRYPNERYIQANMLTKIIYPTGGYTNFYYEPHKYNKSTISLSRKMSMGGGLRVTRMETYADPGDNSPQIKTYKYGENENGYGECSVEPNEDTYLTECYNVFQTADHFVGYRMVNVHNSSTISEYFQFNPPVWYEKVTEYNGEGKTVYNYSFQSDLVRIIPPGPWMYKGVGSHVQPIFHEVHGYGIEQYYNMFSEGLQLKRKEIYAANELINTEEYEYSFFDLGHRLTNVHITKSINNLIWPREIYAFNEYDYLTSTIRLYTRKLTKVTKTTKTRTGDIQEITQSNYTKAPLCNKAWSIYKNSEGETIREEFLYADDDLSGLTTEQKSNISHMKVYNWKTLPVCVIKKVNGEQVARKVTKYNPMYGKENTHYLVPEKEYFQIGGEPEEMRIHYQNYNSYGKPVFIEMDGATRVFYIWSYQNQYPIAEIRNATYEQITSVINTATQSTLATKIEPTAEDWEMVNNLRSHESLKNAQITTWKYKPMVGLTEMTDPAGLTTQYEYDSQNRLKATWLIEKTATGEENKQALKSYDYHYRNQ